MPIFNGLDANELDAVENEYDGMDMCIGHSTPFYAYHYHHWSPCIHEGNSYASKSVAPVLCDTDPDCYDSSLSIETNKANAFTLSLTGYPASTYGEIIGIAKDGHVLYGPKKTDGSLWTCSDHDFCNGVFFDDGHYGYVSTQEFPYTIGCYGPAA